MESTYNHSIVDLRIIVLGMATPRAIANNIFGWGGEAFLPKLDHKSVFRLIPVLTRLVKFQGFFFLG